MSNRLNNDSTKTFKPIIYQFLVALEKCFEMKNDESVWIEKYGDVTNSNGEQIEVKAYQKDLTDLDYNVWKTIKNWLDDGFDISYYYSLVLLTTQTISPTSKFIDWNSKYKDEKLQILNSIADEFAKQSKKAKDTQNLLDNVLDINKSDKLLKILDIFIIESEADNDETLYKKLLETRTDGIIEEKKDEYLDSLVGYVIQPKKTSGGWEIRNKDFRQKTSSLIETYTSTTRIFPKIEMNPLIEEDVTTHQSYPFVKKIEDIDYGEVKSIAIRDFIYARRTLNEELKNYEISKKEYDSYEDEIINSFNTKRRYALRRTNSTNQINKSKDFYDDVTGEKAPDFYNFNDTPNKYRNGLLHEIANDEKKPNKLVWRLEVNDE
ncbi:hypothetical protein CRU99_03440 [Malaciobacter mytili]|uniref:hypothetical protein n=1 Tax=Malaciobacter mytili TaxID=603050 RepID=UPI00100BA40D|nr:hypothetical protein [Malaciobacter mytili]RXI45762.1 hypothetical protein CRU99_03440 [Malaciobacter mytili]